MTIVLRWLVSLTLGPLGLAAAVATGVTAGGSGLLRVDFAVGELPGSDSNSQVSL